MHWKVVIIIQYFAKKVAAEQIEGMNKAHVGRESGDVCVCVWGGSATYFICIYSFVLIDIVSPVMACYYYESSKCAHISIKWQR